MWSGIQPQALITHSSQEIPKSLLIYIHKEVFFLSLTAPLVVPSARCVPEEQKLYKMLLKTAHHVGQVIHIIQGPNK